MSTKITLPGTVTASPFGKYHDYEGTWDSTVFLWDAEYAPLSAIPANAALLDNLLQGRAAEVTGLTEAQCKFEVDNTLNNASAALASGEITGNGGIHVASPQSGAQVAASAFGLAMTADFANWLLSQTDAGADYAVLATLWMRCTRAFTGSPAPQQSFSHFVSSSAATGNNLYYMQSNNGPAGGGGVRLINGQNLPTVVGDAGIGAVSSQGWLGIKPANMSNRSTRKVLNIGASDAWASFNYNKCASYICYRAQVDLVDLSDIAGADRAAKATAMLAELNAMAARDFGAGGRFADDTFTAAATLKP